MKTTVAILTIVLVLAAQAAISVLRADDWPQWRGPRRTGVSAETGLLKQWPSAGPPLIWQSKQIGNGYSTPSVVGDRAFLLSNHELDDEFVQALDVHDGKQVWSTTIGKVGKPDQQPSYPAARSTPTVDGRRLYALGSDGDLVCLEAASGRIEWRKSLREDFGGQSGAWAYAESPLIDGNTLVCTPGGADATIVALDKNTGETIWKCAVPGGDAAGYASAIVVATDGRRQYVQFLAKGLVGVDAKTGAFLWRYDQTGKGPANMPTPVAHDSYIYTAAARTGGGLVELKVDESGAEAKEVYFTRGLPFSIGGSVLADGHLYGTTSQGLVCADFVAGKIVWEDKCVGPGSVCLADGNLYVHGENGDLALVEATPAGYHEKGRFTPPDQPQHAKSKAWTYPVVANGRLYIRDADSLWCYDISDAKSN